MQATKLVAAVISMAFVLPIITGASARDFQIDESSNVIGSGARAQPRSLCNTFGGCSARSIKSGGAVVSSSKGNYGASRAPWASNAPYARQSYGPSLRNSRVKFTARSAAGGQVPQLASAAVVTPATSMPLFRTQQQGERFTYDQPLDLAAHPARVGKLVEDPVKLETIGRGLRMRINQ